jgi:hypothetical protein
VALHIRYQVTGSDDAVLSRILGGGKEFYTENLGWFPEKNNCVPET